MLRKTYIVVGYLHVRSQIHSYQTDSNNWRNTACKIAAMSACCVVKTTVKG